MPKRDALARVRNAAMALAMAQPGYTGYTVQRFREANAALADAQLRAAGAGATAAEISDASEWNGVPL